MNAFLDCANAVFWNQAEARQHFSQQMCRDRDGCPRPVHQVDLPLLWLISIWILSLGSAPILICGSIGSTESTSVELCRFLL